MKSSCCCCGSNFDTRKEMKAHNNACSSMPGIERVIDFKKKHKRKPMNKALRYYVWNNTFGERVAYGPCCCCSREITQQTFEVGHVISVANGGRDNFDNLRTVCRACNSSMGSKDMDVWKAEHFGDLTKPWWDRFTK